jgi:hypothetical protein
LKNEQSANCEHQPCGHKARKTQPLKPYCEFCEIGVSHQIGPHHAKANPASDQAQREREQGDTDPIGLANLGLNRRSFNINIVNGVILFFTFLAIVAYTELTREETSDTRKAFVATQRAWIGIDDVKIVPTYFGNVAPDDVQSQITLVLRNFGNSLATNIRMNWNGAPDEKHLAAVAEGVCWDNSFPLPIRHISIFPNKTTPYLFGSTLPAERIKILDKEPMPFIVGCFTYADPYTSECTDTDRKRCHWTRFCYRTRYDPSTASKLVYDLWNDYNDAH